MECGAILSVCRTQRGYDEEKIKTGRCCSFGSSSARRSHYAKSHFRVATAKSTNVRRFADASRAAG